MHAQSFGSTVIISMLVGTTLIVAPYIAEMVMIWR